MAEERLVKIAKELNVAVTTIVEYLASKGHIIENKPSTKISDELQIMLQQEYSSSMAEKEKADKIVIGFRPGLNDIPEFKEKEEKEVKESKSAFSIPSLDNLDKPTEEVLVKVEESIEEPVKNSIDEPKETVVEVDVKETPISRVELPKLKVVGKIDLDKPKKKPKKKKEDKLAKVLEKPKEKAVIADQKTDVVSDKPQKEEKSKEEQKAKKEVVDEIIRAEAPQLKGLKIMGKIDASKLGGSKSKSSDKTKSQQGQASKSGNGPESNDGTQKKKRKRKKLRTNIASQKTDSKKAGPHAKGRKTEEVKEVTQKEIDDKIKATLARLNTGGKSKRSKLRRDSKEQKREKQEQLESEVADEQLKLTEFISVSELASILDVPVSQVITTCMNLGVIVSINQRLDAEIIELVAGEFGHEVEFITAEEEIDIEEDEEDDPKDLKPRSPVVTVMGHVDHGKTSLLDFIRSGNVASGEAGGITQHIGAYEVKVGPDKKKITFLDTPGHEAFTAMRARGAKITDIAIIIIAADDRVMPQTKEAISHAQAAGVPMIFAINKIDKPAADVDKIKQELASMNLLVEDWGGTYQSQEISAKKGTYVDLLLEKVLLEAEILELKANPDRKGLGTVIEASLDKGRGYTTKVLVQNGSIAIGDPIVAGPYAGKIKAMTNEFGKRVKKAGPSTPVMILGLSGAPQAGEVFKVMDSEQEARQLATKRAQIEREQSNRAAKRISLDEIGRRLALGTFKELNLIVKGDVDGSIEALSDSLLKLSVATIQVNVIHKAVGAIIESDVLLASASDAIIIGFQVRPTTGARNLAEKEGVQIKTYSVIYEVIDEIKSAMEGLLEPTKEEKIVGELVVRETYNVSKVGTIAGCYVNEGRITRNNFIRIIRDGIVIFPVKEGAQGEISSLKRFKDDIKEVRTGLECGLTIKNFNDIKVDDLIEAYEIIEIKQTLE